MRLEARNFAIILIFILFTTYEKTSFTEKAGRSFTNGFSGPKSSRDFRETGPRTRFEKEAKGNSEMAYSHTPYSKCSTGEGLRRRTMKGEGHLINTFFFCLLFHSISGMSSKQVLTFHWFRESFVCKPFPNTRCAISIAHSTAVKHF